MQKARRGDVIGRAGLGNSSRLAADGNLIFVAHANEDARDLTVDLLANIRHLGANRDQRRVPVAVKRTVFRRKPRRFRLLRA